MYRNINEWELFLSEQPKEVLVDIIMERIVQDNIFQKILQNRFDTEGVEAGTAIQIYKEQIIDTIETRYPDTTVIESATRTLIDQMKNWEIYQVCVGCVAIMRILDEALCNGAGMEDGSDFEISMDIENASQYAVKVVKDREISEADKVKIMQYLRGELKTDFGVCSNEILTAIIDEVEKK